MNLLGVVNNFTERATLTAAEVPLAGDGVLLTFDKNVTMTNPTLFKNFINISIQNYTGEWILLRFRQDPTQPAANQIFFATDFHIASTATGMLALKLNFTAALGISTPYIYSINDYPITNNSTFSNSSPALERKITDWGVYLTVPGGAGYITYWWGVMGRLLGEAPSGLEPYNNGTDGIVFGLNPQRMNFQSTLSPFISAVTSTVSSLSVQYAAASLNRKIRFLGTNSPLVSATGSTFGINNLLGHTFYNGGSEVNYGGTGDYFSVTDDDAGNAVVMVGATQHTFAYGGAFASHYLQMNSAQSGDDSTLQFWLVLDGKMDATLEANWQAYIANVLLNGLSAV